MGADPSALGNASNNPIGGIARNGKEGPNGCGGGKAVSVPVLCCLEILKVDGDFVESPAGRGGAVQRIQAGGSLGGSWGRLNDFHHRRRAASRSRAGVYSECDAA